MHHSAAARIKIENTFGANAASGIKTGFRRWHILLILGVIGMLATLLAVDKRLRGSASNKKNPSIASQVAPDDIAKNEKLGSDLTKLATAQSEATEMAERYLKAADTAEISKLIFHSEANNRELRYRRITGGKCWQVCHIIHNNPWS